jgi:hypothetical protein
MLLHIFGTQDQPFIYLLGNVPPLSDSQLQILMVWHQVHVWLGKPILVDTTLVGSQAH